MASASVADVLIEKADTKEWSGLGFDTSGQDTGGEAVPPEEELEVMRMIANGLKDRAIARRLGVSAVTVRRRARRFRDRVGAENRMQAIAIAACKGWLKLSWKTCEGGSKKPVLGDCHNTTD